MTWKMLFTLPLLMLVFSAHAQTGQPRLTCAVAHEGKTYPMFWFAGNNSHHLNGSEYLSVIVKEKSDPGKVEVLIVEMAKDEVWDKLVELTDKNEMSAELRKELRNLGRTRVTKVYVGLYAGLIHFTHQLGQDPNLWEVSCQEVSKN